MEIADLKRLLRELAREDPAFLRDLFLEALRGDGRSAAELLDLMLRHEEVRLKLAKSLLGEVAIPLNVATKDDVKRLEEAVAAIREDVRRLEAVMATRDDIRRLEGVMATRDDIKRLETAMATKEELKLLEEKMATKEDLKRLEDRMATKEQFEDLAVSLEETARSWISHLLKSKGHLCAAERLVIPGAYEIDVYCRAEAVTVIGEAKVRAGASVVEKAAQRAAYIASTRPHLVSGRLVPAVFTLAANPDAVDAARRLHVWLVEWNREIVSLEEAIG
ncbi:MAG: hypothetical protein ACP5KY_04525 [Thermoproteus sp.]